MSEMTQIDNIPADELLRDRRESIEDISFCNLALMRGVTHYSGGSVQDRINVNRMIVVLIDAELDKRGIDHD